ncbi:MAG: phosphatase PAP2 family protein [Coriobacteriales bacterium]
MEGTVLLAFQAIRIGGLTELMALISALGNSALLWVVWALVLLIFQERRRCGAILIVTIVVTSIACILIGNAVARPHPGDMVTGLVPVMGVSHPGYSFPSLHAATGFAAFAVLWRSRFWGMSSAALGFAVLESVSRLYLGVNYFTDVLAGAVLGLLFGIICFTALNSLLSLVDYQPSKPARKQVKASNRGRHSR